MEIINNVHKYIHHVEVLKELTTELQKSQMYNSNFLSTIFSYKYSKLRNIISTV